MLDELKTAWKTYDKKIERSRKLSDKLIMSMISEKSRTRLSKVKRNYTMGVCYMLAWLVAGVIIIISNPFDFEHAAEYLPIAVYCLCMLILTGAMLSTTIKLRNVDIRESNLHESLLRITAILQKYNKPGKLMKLTLKVLLSTAILFPVSFLPRKVASEGLVTGLLDTLLPIGISAIMIAIAFLAGVFKEKNSSRFDEYHSELEELRALSRELTEE